MKTSKFVELCAAMKACVDAQLWLEQNRRKKIITLWNMCDRGDWLLWICKEVDVKEETLVLAACDCVELVFDYMPKGFGYEIVWNVVKGNIEHARKWGQGKIRETTRQYSCVSLDMSISYAVSASKVPLAYIRRTGLYDISGAALCTSLCANWSVQNNENRAISVQKKVLKQCADIVRQHIPFSEFNRRLTSHLLNSCCITE